jgi:hypothetical protein
MILARNLRGTDRYGDTDPDVMKIKTKEDKRMAHRRSSARTKARKGRGLTLATMVPSGWLLAGLSMAISIGLNLPV